MTAAYLPPGKQQFFDANGDKLALGAVELYRPGGLTKKDSWQDYNQTTLNVNPVPLDAAGCCIIFGTGAYRQIVKDVLGNVIWDRETTVGNQSAQTLASGAIQGLAIANNAGTPNTQVDIAAGQCRDSTNTTDLILTAGLTKRLDAVWAAGTGQGGRDSAAALAAGQSYHVFVIYNPTTDAVDALLSQSATAPTLPSGYTLFRRIAALPLLGSAVSPPAGTSIPAFDQWGDLFLLAHPNNEFTGQTGSAAAALKTMLVPLGIKVRAIMYAQMLSPGGLTILMRITEPGLGAPPAFGGTDQFAQIRVAADELYRTTMVEEPTNTTGQVYVHASDVNGVWALKSRGWWDYRNQF